MRRLNVAIASLAIAAAAAACGASGATTAPASTTAQAPSAAPSVAATPAPSAVPSASTAASPSAPIAPSISLAEWKVVVSGTIKAGKTTLTIHNDGVAAHEFLVFKSNRDASAYPVDKAGNIIEEGAGVALISDGENIDAGGSQTRTIDLAPGKYLFVCNIPGHFRQGMFTAVTVAP
jgi:uncharacterized cupredoxin-like copper-binding protein